MEPLSTGKRYTISGKDSVVCVARHCGLFEGGSPRKFRSFQAQAERKTQMLDSAKNLTCVCRRATDWMTNGEFVLAGETTARGTWKSSTTIEDEHDKEQDAPNSEAYKRFVLERIAVHPINAVGELPPSAVVVRFAAAEQRLAA